MAKQPFTFTFPLKGENITMSLTPFQVKDTAIAYVTKQNEVRGDLCLITDGHGALVAIAYCDDHMSAHFFTEDHTGQDIPSLHDAAFDD